MSDPDRSASAVDRVYEELKDLAIRYDIKPGSRLNEVQLARRLGVSRTPLREALNRLTASGLLTYSPSEGFFRKSLDATEIFQLYELRQAIEVASVRLAVQRATPEALDRIEAFVRLSSRSTEQDGIDKLVQLDESFHQQIVDLTGNHQIAQTLYNINDRIRFVRWIDMENEKRRTTQREHRQVVAALRSRDGDRAAELLAAHIDRRMDQIIAQVREGYARIYVDSKPSGAKALS